MFDSPYSLKIGTLDLNVVSDGDFLLDGGTVFGIIPKVMWERLTPVDEKNRMAMGLNCILVRTGDHNVLIDVGLGRTLTPKMRDIYEVSESRDLMLSLDEAGISRDEIDIVIPSHLHLDHAGWCTMCDSDGAIVPTFPNALYLVQEREWQDALAPDELSKGTYLEENFVPLKEAGVLELIDGDTQVCKGVKAIVTGGHTPAHQVVLVESDNEAAIFLGDLVPTSMHLAWPYITAYDYCPPDTLAAKKRLLHQAAEENWVILWNHDPRIPASRIVIDNRGKPVALPVEEKR